MKSNLTRKAVNRKAPPPKPAPPPAVEETAPDASIPGFREGLAFLAGTEDFEHLLRQSLAFAREVMDMTTPADATAADRLKLMSLKKEVMASVMSTGVRVNDSALRRKGEDKVAELLARVKGKTSVAPEPAAADDEAKAELFS